MFLNGGLQRAGHDCLEFNNIPSRTQVITSSELSTISSMRLRAYAGPAADFCFLIRNSTISPDSVGSANLQL